MRMLPLRRTGLGMGAGLMLLGLQFVSAAAATAPEAPGVPSATNAPAAAPKAIFLKDLANGRDPFFPNSTRTPRKASGDTNDAPVKISVLDHLTLKGIATGKKPLALINNLTLAEGEKGQIKINGKPVVILCQRIQQRSVIVAAPATEEVKELQLREQL